MMDNRKERLETLINSKGIEKLKNSKIIVFGLGGVGSFSIEALARSFISNITIVDFDTIDITNINRQIHALTSTIGLYKTDEIEKRVIQINPECNIKKYSIKLDENNVQSFFEEKYDYVIDAIDDYNAKKALILYCKKNKIKIISAMGLGNKLDPTKISITKLSKTKSCPLARKLRRELKNINLDVVSSIEHPIKHNKTKPGSTSFVPSVGGIFAASFVINRLLSEVEKN